MVRTSIHISAIVRQVGRAFLFKTEKDKIGVTPVKNPQWRQKILKNTRLNEKKVQKKRIICRACGGIRKEKTMQEYLAGYNRAVENANFAIYQKAQTQEIEARGRLQEEMVSAQIEITKRATMEEVITYEKKQREKNRSDIASLRQLQKTEVVISTEGEVEIRKELFGEMKSDRTNFRIVNFMILQSLQDREKEALAIEFSCTGRTKKVFFDTANSTPKVLKKIFNQAGIQFKFSPSKEAEVRERLIVYLLEVAPIKILPVSHGWFRDERGTLGFAYPDSQTWQEIERLI